jgi:hypothetical protein
METIKLNEKPFMEDSVLGNCRRMERFTDFEKNNSNYYVIIHLISFTL